MPSGRPSELTQRLVNQLQTDSLECLVCTLRISRQSSAWSCSSCFNIFHLNCARSWSKQSVGEGGTWRCPGCQSSQRGGVEYFCFCHREKNPRAGTGLPHSCGQDCLRPRKCGHPCPMRCHPGPCPPCNVTVDVSCWCSKVIHQSKFCDGTTPSIAGEAGRNEPTTRSGPSSEQKSARTSKWIPKSEGAKSSPAWISVISCGNVCGKSLGCPAGHRCEDVCHEGGCRPCSKEVDSLQCHCGRQQKVIICGQQKDENNSFSCGNICGKIVSSCGHNCVEACHEGDCTKCSRHPSTFTTCACGKKTIASLRGITQTGLVIASKSKAFSSSTTAAVSIPQNVMRTACTDPLPSCGAVCGKSVGLCGHGCQLICGHEGACPPCATDRFVILPCACTGTKVKIHCAEMNSAEAVVQKRKCNRKCGKLMACGRHRCQETCCTVPANEHLCLKECGRPFPSCGHQCPRLCHRDACGDCPNIITTVLRCACGSVALQPPQPCSTKPPSCAKPCRFVNKRYSHVNESMLIPEPSTSPSATTATATSSTTASIPMEVGRCGHTIPRHPCHFGACPPCQVPVHRACSGGHTMLSGIACSLKEVNCGAVCGKVLQCGEHTCRRLCHGGECLIAPPPSKRQLRKQQQPQQDTLEKRKEKGETEVGVDKHESPPPPVLSSSCLTSSEEDEAEDGHDGELVVAKGNAITQSCGGVCDRMMECGHRCTQQCHGSLQRPCRPDKCKVAVNVFCECGRMSKSVPCTKVFACRLKEMKAQQRKAKNAAAIASPEIAAIVPAKVKEGEMVARWIKSKEINSGQQQPQQEAEEEPLLEIRIGCDAECIKQYRLRGLAEGLGIKDAPWRTAAQIAAFESTRSPLVFYSNEKEPLQPSQQQQQPQPQQQQQGVGDELHRPSRNMKTEIVKDIWARQKEGNASNWIKGSSTSRGIESVLKSLRRAVKSMFDEGVEEEDEDDEVEEMEEEKEIENEEVEKKGEEDIGNTREGIVEDDENDERMDEKGNDVVENEKDEKDAFVGAKEMEQHIENEKGKKEEINEEDQPTQEEEEEQISRTSSSSMYQFLDAIERRDEEIGDGDDDFQSLSSTLQPLQSTLSAGVDRSQDGEEKGDRHDQQLSGALPQQQQQHTLVAGVESNDISIKQHHATKEKHEKDPISSSLETSAYLCRIDKIPSTHVNIKGISITAPDGPSHVLLNFASLTLLPNHRYGLVGRNGVGKTTLLRLMGSGALPGWPPPPYRTALCSAEVTAMVSLKWLREKRTNLSCVVGGRPRSREQMSVDAVVKASKMLASLQFSTAMMDAPFETLSIGWRFRVLLARALFMCPDLLLLDEPNGHLDLPSIVWLSHMLQVSSGMLPKRVSVVVASHDAAFLDDICTDVIHFNDRNLTHYPGDFASFVQRAEEKRSAHSNLFATLEMRRNHLQQIVEHGRSLATSGNANAAKTASGLIRSRLTALKMLGAPKREDGRRWKLLYHGWRRVIANPAGGPPETISIPDEPPGMTGEGIPPGTTLLEMKNATISVGGPNGRVILQDVNFSLQSGQKIVLVGANGQGKTIFLHALAESLRRSPPHQEGDGDIHKERSRVEERDVVHVDIEDDVHQHPQDAAPPEGPTRQTMRIEEDVKCEGDIRAFGICRVALVSQNRSELISHENDTPTQLLLKKFERLFHGSQTAARKVLGAMGLTKALAVQPIGHLSAGQKTKLCLVMALCHLPHVLLLDEPTAHLDYETISLVENALATQFVGSIVTVTHNLSLSENLHTDGIFVVNGGHIRRWSGSLNDFVKELVEQ